MDDFNDAEQDWFSDVNDEPIKSNLFVPVDSPCGGGMGRADSRLSDFNALNVPVDDSFYVPVTQQQSNDVPSYNASGANYTANNDVSTAYYDPTGGSNYAEMSSNVGGGDAIDVDDVDTSFPQPFQESPAARAAVRNAEISTRFEMPPFNSSSYIDCPPSTSTASHAQNGHDVVYSQQQQHQPQQQYQIISNINVLQQEQQNLQQQRLLNNSHQQPLLEQQQQTHLYQCSQSQLPQQQSQQQQFHQQPVFQAKTYYPSSSQHQLSSGNNVAESTSSNFVYAQQQPQHFLQQQSQQQRDVQQQQYSSYASQQASTSAAATGETSGSYTFGNQPQLQLQYSNAQMYPQQILITSQPQTHVVQTLNGTPSQLGVPTVSLPSQTQYVDTIQYAPQTSPSSLTAPQNSTNRRTSKPNARRQSKQNLFGRAKSSTISAMSMTSSSTIPAGTGSSTSSTSGFTLGAVMQKIFANAGDANAAVRFTPERNAEFLAMINQLNELRDRQDKTGVPLGEEISAVEERIINMLSAAEPDNVKTTPNDSAINYQMGASAIDIGTTKTGRGKARRLAAPRAHFPQTNQTSQAQLQPTLQMASAPIMDIHAPLQASTSAGIVAVDGSGGASTTYGAYTTMTVPNSEPAMQLSKPNLPNGVVMMSTDNRNMILVPTNSDEINNSSNSVELAHHQTIVSQHQSGSVGTYLLADGTTTSALTAMPMPLDIAALPPTPPQPQATLIAPRPRSKARQNQRVTASELTANFSPNMGPPLAPMTNYGKTKRAINYAEKYQELAEQKLKLEEEKRVQEQPTNDPPLVQTVTIKKIDPPLANMSGQMLEAIISRVTLQRDADTAISVNINGEILTLVVHMTLAPQQTPLSQQQQLQQQSLTPIQTMNYLPPTRTTMPFTKAPRHRGGRTAASTISTTPATSTLISARDRASNALTSMSTTSATSNTTSTSSTFDLDDTIARVVCQQASLAGTSTSSSIRNLMNSDDHMQRGSGALINVSKETTLGAALQPYARGPARRKSKAKNTAMSSQLELLTKMDMTAPPTLLAGSQATPMMITPNGAAMTGTYAPTMMEQTSQLITQPGISSLMVPPPQEPIQISQSAIMMTPLEPIQPAKPQLPVLPAPTELGKKIAASRAERAKKLSEQIDTLRNSLGTIDYFTPFKNRKDSLNRLLPYAFLYESDFSEEFMGRIDHNLLRQSIELDHQKAVLERRMREILFKESMVEHSTRHELNLLLFLDGEYERRALATEKRASRENSHVDPLTKSVEDVSKLSGDARKFDFDYHEFDPAKYRNISPYISPVRRSPIALSDDDDDENDKINSSDTNTVMNEEDINNDEDLSDEDEYEEYSTNAEDDEETEKHIIDTQFDELTQIEEMELTSSSVDNILMKTDNCESASISTASEITVSQTCSQSVRKRSSSYNEDVVTTLKLDVYERATHSATLYLPQDNMPSSSPTIHSSPTQLGTLISTDDNVPTPPMWNAESLHAANPPTSDSFASDAANDMNNELLFIADVNQSPTLKQHSNVPIEAPACMPAVKLKIKLGKQNIMQTPKSSMINDTKYLNSNGEDKVEDRRRAKEEKRRRKEEKRQRKLLKRQKKEGAAQLARMKNGSDREATNSDAEAAQLLSPPQIKAFSSENYEMSKLDSSSLVKSELKKTQKPCWQMSSEMTRTASSNGFSAKTEQRNSIVEAINGVSDEANVSSNGQSLKLRISKRALISSSMDFSIAPSTSLSASANSTTNPLSIKIARNGVIRNINDDTNFRNEESDNSATNETSSKKKRKKHETSDISRAERKRRKKREREERREAERRNNEQIDEMADAPPTNLPKKLPMLRIRLPRPEAAMLTKNNLNLSESSIDEALGEMKTSPPKTSPNIDMLSNNSAQHQQSQQQTHNGGIANRQTLPDIATNEFMSNGGRFLFAGVPTGGSIVFSTASSTWLSSSIGTTFPPMMTGHTAFSMATTSAVATAAGSVVSRGLQNTSYNALRFSPCSEDSDDEQLRNRTDQLLTKLKGHV